LDSGAVFYIFLFEGAFPYFIKLGIETSRYSQGGVSKIRELSVRQQNETQAKEQLHQDTNRRKRKMK
jgi:hypothetical protein